MPSIHKTDTSDMEIHTTHPLIDSILADWKARVGDAYAGYRGHVYRVYNFALALRPCNEEDQRKLAIAACFHDIGIWSDHTVDYIPPSMRQATAYLEAADLAAWREEIELMIDMHHKLRRYSDDRYPLVAVFRAADIVDFYLGLYTCGLPRSYVRQVKAAIPNDGFHTFLAKSAGAWFKAHPLSPPPFFKW